MNGVPGTILIRHLMAQPIDAPRSTRTRASRRRRRTGRRTSGTA